MNIVGIRDSDSQPTSCEVVEGGDSSILVSECKYVYILSQ